MNDDHDVQYGVTHETYGTCLVCGTTAGWSEEEQRFVHGRTSGLLAEGTERPTPGDIISSPGEFAAVWNSRTPEQRADWVRAWSEAVGRGSMCMMSDHRGYIDHLEKEAQHLIRTLHRIRDVVWARRKWHGRELRRRLRAALRSR